MCTQHSTLSTYRAEEKGDLFVVFFAFKPLVVSINPDDVQVKCADYVCTVLLFTNQNRVGTGMNRNKYHQVPTTCAPLLCWRVLTYILVVACERTANDSIKQNDSHTQRLAYNESVSKSPMNYESLSTLFGTRLDATHNVLRSQVKIQFC